MIRSLFCRWLEPIKIASHYLNLRIPYPVWPDFGDIWKLLATNSVAKVAQIFANFLGIYKQTPFKYKLKWPLLEKFRLLFNPTSGHTSHTWNATDDHPT